MQYKIQNIGKTPVKKKKIQKIILIPYLWVNPINTLLIPTVPYFVFKLIILFIKNAI